MTRHGTFLLIVAISVALLLTACRQPQPTYVRGSDLPGIDDPAMGLGLDRRDLQQLTRENLDSFFASRFFQRSEANLSGPPSTMAIMTMENWTTEHIEPQLHALLGMLETEMVNSGVFTVIAAALRERLMNELYTAQGEEFDQARALNLGRQLGVQYFLTGRVVDASERTANARRVQYFMFMQVLEVETGAIVWQNQAELTKGIVPL